MLKNLRKNTELYYYENDKKILGANPDMDGDCSGLRGDCTWLCGDCSGLISDLDDCNITDEERKAGINIIDLIGEE